MKFISFSFDDGFERSATVGAPILERFGFNGTFYVVTGWVAPQRARIRDDFNRGASHGDWAFWRGHAARGHEVGSHGFSHVNAGASSARFLPWVMAEQVLRSAEDLARHVPATDYTLSMPWNAGSKVSRALARTRFSACRLGSTDLDYNTIHALDLYGLKSWAVEPKHGWSDVRAAVEQMPDDGWLIFQFHSFDDEGWAPISSGFLEALCEVVADVGVEVAPVRDVVRRLCGGEPIEQAA